MNKTDEIVTYPQAIIGYRAWELWDHQLYPLLQSRNHPWHPGENKAHCIYSFHHSPAEGCHCGFNAWHSLKDAINYPDGSRYPAVIGIIAGAGTARVHHHGTRFEKAQILAIAPCAETIRSNWHRFESSDEYLAEVRATAKAYGAVYCADYRQLKSQAEAWEDQGLVTPVSAGLIPAAAATLIRDGRYSLDEYFLMLLVGFAVLFFGTPLFLFMLRVLTGLISSFPGH